MTAAEPLKIVSGQISAGESRCEVDGSRHGEDRGKACPLASGHENLEL
jgi:hypothetical protein